jgi:hypothetical protein
VWFQRPEHITTHATGVQGCCSVSCGDALSRLNDKGGSHNPYEEAQLRGRVVERRPDPDLEIMLHLIDES